MKYLSPYIMAIILIANCCTNAYSQSSSTGNIGIPNRPVATSPLDYLGWDGTVGYPLQIRTNNVSHPYPINFYTDSIFRMTIFEDSTNASAFNAGYVGLNIDTPQSRLHQHTPGPATFYAPNSNYHQFTNSNTGDTASNMGLQVGIRYDYGEWCHYDLNGPQPPFSIAEMRQWMCAPIDFYVNNCDTGTAGGMKQRMHITYGHGWNGSSDAPNVTKVNINYGNVFNPIGTCYSGAPANPVAILNLGDNVYIGGDRAWMDVGTFGAYRTDDFYVGLKAEGVQDSADAVLAWGDDDYSFVGQQKYLRFIFVGNTSLSSSGQSSKFDGLEVTRITPDAHFGIGNFSRHGGSATDPARMLEVYDPSLVNPTSAYALPPAPQLRLTYLPDSINRPGIWTDFQTTNHGDLYIHPDSVNKNRRVGINTSTPGNTLEINSDSTYKNPGWAGLRFHDLTSDSSVAGNPNGKVLTVNTNGDVILVRDSVGTGSGGINYHTCSSPDSLPSNVTMQLNNGGSYYNIYYKGQDKKVNSNPVLTYTNSAAINTAIGVGYSCGDSLPAKFSVEQHVPDSVIRVGTIACYVQNADSSVGSITKRALYGINNGVLTNGGSTAGKNIGGDFEALNCDGGDIAVRGRAGRNATTPGDSAVGGQFETYNSNNAEGVVTTVNGTVKNNAIGDSINISATVTNYDAKGMVIEMPGGVTNGSAVGEKINMTGIVKQKVTGEIINVAGSATGSAGIIITSTSATSSIGANNGIIINANDSNPTWNAGLVSIASKSTYRNIGVQGWATVGNSLPVLGTTTNIGVWGIADYNTSCTSNNIAVFGDIGPTCTTCSDSPCAMPPAPGNWSGFFNGSVYAAAGYFASDSTLKDSITTITDALSALSQLSLKKYIFRRGQYASLQLPSGFHYGLLSQQVQKVHGLENLVKPALLPARYDAAGNQTYAPVGFLTLNYPELIGLCIGAVNQLSAHQQLMDSIHTVDSLTINSLNNRMTNLESIVANCCHAGGRTIDTTGSNNNNTPQGDQQNTTVKSINVNLDNANSDLLISDAFPNPFSGHTTISFTVPDGQQATIMFFDELGRVIKQLSVSGTGQLNIDGSNLKNSIYGYSIQSGDKMITKKMVKQD